MKEIEILEKYLHTNKDIEPCEIEAIIHIIERLKDLEKIEKCHKEENGKLREQMKRTYNEGYFKGVRDERNNTDKFIEGKIQEYTEKLKSPLINTQTIEKYTYGIVVLQDILQEK